MNYHITSYFNSCIYTNTQSQGPSYIVLHKNGNLLKCFSKFHHLVICSHKYYHRLGNNALCPSKSGYIVKIIREKKSACTLFCKSQVPRKCFVLSSISLFHNNELRISAVFYERECPNLSNTSKTMVNQRGVAVLVIYSKIKRIFD